MNSIIRRSIRVIQCNNVFAKNVVCTQEGARHCRKTLGRRSLTKGPIYRFFELVTTAPFNFANSLGQNSAHILGNGKIFFRGYRTFSLPAPVERLSTVSSPFMVFYDKVDQRSFDKICEEIPSFCKSSRIRNILTRFVRKSPSFGNSYRIRNILTKFCRKNPSFSTLGCKMFAQGMVCMV